MNYNSKIEGLQIETNAINILIKDIDKKDYINMCFGEQSYIFHKDNNDVDLLKKDLKSCLEIFKSRRICKTFDDIRKTIK